MIPPRSGILFQNSLSLSIDSLRVIIIDYPIGPIEYCKHIILFISALSEIEIENLLVRTLETFALVNLPIVGRCGARNTHCSVEKWLSLRA